MLNSQVLPQTQRKNDREKPLFLQKNYFLQWNATAAGSSQSNISRLYILKKQSIN